jgi:polysaccharide biosynthesis protein PslH
MLGQPHGRDEGPRVLYLTHHLPFPPRSGGTRREFELLRRVCAAGTRVHLVAVSKSPERAKQNSARFETETGCTAEVFAADLAAANGGTPRSVNGAAGEAPQIARHRSAGAARRVAELLATRSFDVLHVEGFYLWPCLEEVAQADLPPILLVEHNIEHSLWAQRAENRQGVERRRMAAAADATRAAELEAWERAELCAAVTPADRAAIEAHLGRSVALVPNGVDHLGSAEGGSAALNGSGPAGGSAPRVAMVGNFGYEPNADGAMWFIEEVLPRLRARAPEALLELVGASPPLSLRDAARFVDGVELHADVPSVAPYLERAEVVICPLRVGGGIKVKTLEALAAGKATVTTSVGAQGLERASGRALVVRDDPGEFAATVAQLLDDVGLRRELEGSARAFVRSELPRWDGCASELLGLWRRLAATGPRNGRPPAVQPEEPVAA